ncbi:hypothetical protein, partial [Veillonella infantium]|uniref:hypothetical protein n=1 Tax=Veillonella infantium TaxID=1911679 RepID=UPI0026ECD2CB
MIIYSSTKQSFIQDFEQGVLVKKLHQTLTEKYRRVGESEIHSGGQQYHLPHRQHPARGEHPHGFYC